MNTKINLKHIADKLEWEPRMFPVSILVFHCFALSTKQMLSVFKKTGTSIHYIIQRDGKILSLIPENKVAYHAGISSWREFSEKINKHSIGIEIQNSGMGEINYTEKQIKSIITLSKELITKYKIKPENIVGHSDIAPTRKPDPGRTFPWKFLAHHGIGINCKTKNESCKKVLSQKEIRDLLTIIGYNTQDINAALYSFIKRYAPQKLTKRKDIIQIEAKIFNFLRNKKNDKNSLCPCIYPENMIKLQKDEVVINTLKQISKLFIKESIRNPLLEN